MCKVWDRNVVPVATTELVDDKHHLVCKSLRGTGMIKQWMDMTLLSRKETEM